MKALRMTLPLGALSRHRAALYGIAAVLLMISHAPLDLPANAIGRVAGWMKEASTCAVELFVLLSPMGLYRSLKSGRRLAAFYRRRLLRVALPAFIVAAVFYGSNAGSVSAYLLSLTFISYWFGHSTFWYVGFILTMYALYPAIYALQRRSPRALWALFVGSILFSLFVDRVFSEHAAVYGPGIDRIPIFLLGCILAPKIERNDRVPAWICALALVVYIPVWSYTMALGHLRSYWLLAMSNFLLVLGLLPLLTALFEWLARGAFRRYLYRLAAMAGAVSLEIYLLYTRVLDLLEQADAYQSGTASDVKCIVAAFVITPIAAMALSAFCRAIEQAFHATRAPKIDAKG